MMETCTSDHVHQSMLNEVSVNYLLVNGFLDYLGVLPSFVLPGCLPSRPLLSTPPVSTLFCGLACCWCRKHVLSAVLCQIICCQSLCVHAISLFQILIPSNQSILLPVMFSHIFCSTMFKVYLI